ncbi:divalent cation tolerance protein CutA [Streptomyces sp. NPDC004549]|uniref:divalent cation tolerance protein CutA n=1 Tax=Streptomyces sp. NPDC004549 TaxID=3154283 RepID=UPI0033B4CC24
MAAVADGRDAVSDGALRHLAPPLGSRRATQSLARPVAPRHPVRDDGALDVLVLAAVRGISYKTTTDRLPALAARVVDERTRAVPEWITIPITDGSEAYLGWVAEETTEY